MMRRPSSSTSSSSSTLDDEMEAAPRTGTQRHNNHQLLSSSTSSSIPPGRATRYITPAPTYTPIFAGSAAGGISTMIQHATHFAGNGHTHGLLFAPSPLTATMPAIAAYFTTYELMKTELGLSPSFGGVPIHYDDAASQYARLACDDPRAALLSPGHTARYFGAASSAGALSQIVKMTITPGGLSLASAFASTAQVGARMGIQFSVFEQAKNAFACFRHKNPCEELSVAEVLFSASLGGVVAASVLYPLQHLLPTQHWTLTAPPPAGNSKPSLRACLYRFLPACVATAVTYEFAYRYIRNRSQEDTIYQHHQSLQHQQHNHQDEQEQYRPHPQPSFLTQLIERISSAFGGLPQLQSTQQMKRRDRGEDSQVVVSSSSSSTNPHQNHQHDTHMPSSFHHHHSDNHQPTIHYLPTHDVRIPAHSMPHHPTTPLPHQRRFSFSTPSPIVDPW